MIKQHLYYILFIIALISSCDDDFNINEQNKQSDRVSFNVNLNNVSLSDEARTNDSNPHGDVQVELLDEKFGADSLFLFTIIDDSISPNIRAKENQSRGTEITTSTIADMGVLGIIYKGVDYTDWGTSGSDAIMYIFNEQCTKSTSWNTRFYWPQTENTRMRFFTYSPYGTITYPNMTGTPTFDYVISDKVVEQKDLLVASSDVACPNDYKAAPITFAHALTAVKFEVANNVKNLVVKAIRVKGVYYKGSYTYQYSGANEDDGDDTTPFSSDKGSWNVVEIGDDVVTDYEIKLNNIVCDGTGTENIALNEGEYVMMLMPQTLPQGAMIEVDVTDMVLNRDVTLKSKIEGNEWGKGKMVTYCISASDEIIQYVFETENVKIPEYYGGEGRFRVKSYKKTTRFDGERIEPVAWTIDDVVDDERNKTAVWMKDLKGYNGNGVSNETDWETINYKMGPAPLKLVTTHWQEARSHTNYHIAQCGEKGTYSNPYDLSTNGGASSMNTANCYIVGYAGHYRFPVVYGNAIGGGAYNGSDYVDHLDKSWINTPWIDSRYNVNDVYLVWQDAPGLVSDLRLIDGGDGHAVLVGVDAVIAREDVDIAAVDGQVQLRIEPLILRKDVESAFTAYIHGHFGVHRAVILVELLGILHLSAILIQHHRLGLIDTGNIRPVDGVGAALGENNICTRSRGVHILRGIIAVAALVDMVEHNGGGNRAGDVHSIENQRHHGVGVSFRLVPQIHGDLSAGECTAETVCARLCNMHHRVFCRLGGAVGISRLPLTVGEVVAFFIINNVPIRVDGTFLRTLYGHAIVAEDDGRGIGVGVRGGTCTAGGKGHQKCQNKDKCRQFFHRATLLFLSFPLIVDPKPKIKLKKPRENVNLF